MRTNSGVLMAVSGWQRNLRGLLVCACVAALGGPAMGQVIKILQPWTPLRASHISWVQSCANPQPMGQILFDDWTCPQTGPIIRAAWWGTVNTTAQLDRPFYIAIYADNGACGPAARLYQTCVVARHRRVGTDCENREVYRFTALIPAFGQMVGNTYWLQISEPDQESATAGAVDWRWSAHIPIGCTCPALRFQPGVGFGAVIDPCYGDPEDLAFGLAARSISGKIDLTLVEPPYSFEAHILSPAGVLLETLPVQPDQDGFYDIWPELPDGNYILQLHGMGALPLQATIVLATGADTLVNFAPVRLGDLDGNDVIEAQDLALLLANFGATFP